MKRAALLSLTVAALIVTVSTAFAGPSIFHLRGIIGQHVSWDILGLDPSDIKDVFTDVTDSDFDQGYIEITNAIQFTDIDANSPVYLKLESNGWTLPTGYDTANGPKKTDGSDSELLLKINTGSITVSGGTLQAEGSFGASYTAVNNTAANFLKLGEIGGGSIHTGVRDGVVNVDARVLLDPEYDIPGIYEIELEITVAPQP